MADEDEHSVDAQLASVPGLQVAQADGLHFAVSDNLFHDRVPHELNLLIGQGPPLQGFPRAQLIASMDHLDLVGEPGEEDALLDRAVASAYNHNVLLAKEEPIAGGTERHTPSDEFILARDAQPLGGCPDGDDHRIGLVNITVGFDGERRPLREVDLGHLVDNRPGPKCFCLGPHQLHQLGSGGALRESRIVLDLAGNGDLATQLCTGNHQRFELGPGDI